MKLLSINVASPREVLINGRPVLTGIYKERVEGAVELGRLSLTGDGQADLTVHGGEHQAAYVYSYDHYDHWQRRLGREPFAFGMFGENFTVDGMLEEDVCVGDCLSIGGAIVQVTMPRVPCFKFGHKIDKPDLLKEFLQSGRSGFYLRVLQEGPVEAGQVFQWVERDPYKISIRTVLGMQKLGEGDPKSVARALQIASLCPVLRRELESRWNAF